MDLRGFLERRGHAAALAVSALLLAAAAAHAALCGDGRREGLALRTAVARATLDANPAPGSDPPDLGALRSAWEPGALAAPAGRGTFVSAPRPRVVVRVVGGAKPAEPVRLLPLPAVPLPRAEVSPGRIELRWPAAGGGAGFAEIASIRVWRRAAGEREATAVATLEGGATSWDDEGVAARTAYEYRLQLVARDGAGTTARESALSAPAAATAPADFEISCSGCAEQAAVIVVRRRIGGEWLEHSFTVWPRGEDGVPDGAIGGRVVRGQRALDFSTGCVLTAIRRATRRFAVAAVERRFENGVAVDVPVRREVARDWILLEYRDETGAARRLWKADPFPAGGEPLGDDDR